MTLKEQMSADVSAVFLNTNEFAQAVTYTPSGGGGSSINAVFDESADPSYEEDGKIKIRRGTLVISIADVSAPAHGDAVTVSSEAWEVLSITWKDAYMASLELRRIETIERSAPTHRIQRG